MFVKKNQLQKATLHLGYFYGLQYHYISVEISLINMEVSTISHLHNFVIFGTTDNRFDLFLLSLLFVIFSFELNKIETC